LIAITLRSKRLQHASDFKQIGASARHFPQVRERSPNGVATAAMDFGKVRGLPRVDRLDGQISALFADDLKPRSSLAWLVGIYRSIP